MPQGFSGDAESPCVPRFGNTARPDELEDTKRSVEYMTETLAPDNYSQFLASLKTRIQAAQLRASLAVNRELVLLYWQLGRDILERQQRQSWGAKVIDRLAADLKRAFPDMKGFSPRNLKYMRAFAEAWPEEEIVQQRCLHKSLVPQCRGFSRNLSGFRGAHLVRQGRHSAWLEPQRPRPPDRERTLPAAREGRLQFRADPPEAPIRARARSYQRPLQVRVF